VAEDVEETKAEKKDRPKILAYYGVSQKKDEV
jgi:hypothetical protein